MKKKHQKSLSDFCSKGIKITAIVFLFLIAIFVVILKLIKDDHTLSIAQQLSNNISQNLDFHFRKYENASDILGDMISKKSWTGKASDNIENEIKSVEKTARSILKTSKNYLIGIKIIINKEKTFLFCRQNLELKYEPYPKEAYAASAPKLSKHSNCGLSEKDHNLGTQRSYKVYPIQGDSKKTTAFADFMEVKIGFLIDKAMLEDIALQAALEAEMFNSASKISIQTDSNRVLELADTIDKYLNQIPKWLIRTKDILVDTFSKESKIEINLHDSPSDQYKDIAKLSVIVMPLIFDLHIVSQILAVLAIGVVISLLGLLYFSRMIRQISKPIEEMKQNIEFVCSRNFHEPIKEKGPLEVRYIRRSIENLRKEFLLESSKRLDFEKEKSKIEVINQFTMTLGPL